MTICATALVLGAGGMALALFGLVVVAALAVGRRADDASECLGHQLGRAPERTGDCSRGIDH